eukprot:TRINITY_DN503_c0_g1_i3.p1 TRINITY_DN503_c0_g1~~TRINITY_DN503_c0_g1_i3.p1  ORF type:complete len:500 (+),score=57.18 TRINITY_DN503_c0_g1_i3:254-1753(+)
MMDSLSPKPVIELDFRLLTHLPSNADGFGVQMTPAGISLSGPKAYLNLPLALPIGAYLKSKSILVCLRFVNSRESIQLGLESSDGMRSEKLAIGSDLEGVPHGVWVLHRSSQLPTTTFGSSAPVEHEINFDIHLALVVDASRPPTATFTCYRESEQYGQPARLGGGAAVFQASDGIVFSIQHSGTGSVIYSFVKIFDRALREDELQPIANGVSAGPLLDERLNISGFSEISRHQLGGPAEVGKEVAEATSSRHHGSEPPKEQRERAAFETWKRTVGSDGEATWDRFWELFEGDLHIWDDEERARFQDQVCRNPVAPKIKRAEWVRAVSSSASALDFWKNVKERRWSSAGLARGQADGQWTHKVEAPAGAFIVQWKVTTRQTDVVYGQETFTLDTVVGIQGKSSSGQWLDVLGTGAGAGDAGAGKTLPEQPNGFTRVTGRTGGWLTNFMGVGAVRDPPWEDFGERAGLTPSSRVVGYQMRVTSNYVETARFLFAEPIRTA